jgi:hypothetical protein
MSWRTGLVPALLLFWCPVVSAASSPPLSVPAEKFYPGIEEGQSMRAHEALRAFYNGNSEKAARLLREMDAQEDRDSLPPLSRLLRTAMLGLTLQRDDAGTPEDAARMRAALDSAADKGLRRCGERAERAQRTEDADRRVRETRKVREARQVNRVQEDDPTCLLIRGGIKGFRVILKLNTHAPLEILDEGLGAVALLEKALAADSSVRDVHMGLGIFHAMAASNSPRLGRAVLRVAGHGISMEEGLAHLRRSGYEGQYTSVASQFYLIQFLSPYDDGLRREKREIFRSLRETFPLAAHTLFFQNEEALSFYPDSFYRPRTRASLARRLRAVESRDYAGLRYANLVKYQYGLLDPNPPGNLLPDTSFRLGGYGFYPDFIAALRLRREITEAGAASPLRAERIAHLAEMRKKLLTRLRKTPKTELNPQNRGLFLWHVNDALRPEQFVLPAHAADQDGEDTVSTSKAAGKSRKPPDK